MAVTFLAGSSYGTARDAERNRRAAIPPSLPEEDQHPVGTEPLPPGQRLTKGWPVSHYGPVPKFRPDRWNFQVFGATATGGKYSWTFDEVSALPGVTIETDLHCASGPTSTDHEFFGIAAHTVLELAPPARRSRM